MSDPGRGRTKERGENSRRLAAAERATVSVPAATGRPENLQAEAEAQPEGENSKHKRQPADRRKCSAGGPGIIPMVREEQWIEPIIPVDTQPQ